METIFGHVLTMSLTSSIVILAVLVVRFFLKGKSRSITCFLWLLVALRLVMPFTIKSSISLLPKNNLPQFERTVVVPEVNNYDLIPVDNSDEFASESSDSLMESEINESIEMPSDFSIDRLSIVWIIGVSFMSLYGGISSILLKRKLRTAIAGEDGIYISDDIDSPFVLGVIFPRIYIPSALSTEVYPYVIEHERAHLRRGDNFWKLFAFVLLSVYWFNTLMWIAFLLFERDIELACDEKVIAGMDVADKKAYANALLSYANHKRVVLSYPLYFGEIGIKDRIRAVKNYRNPGVGLIVIASILFGIVSGCFLTDPKVEAAVVDMALDEKTSGESVDRYEDLMSGPVGATLFDSDVVLETDACTVQPYWYTFDGCVFDICYGASGDTSAEIWLITSLVNDGVTYAKTSYSEKGSDFKICHETLFLDSSVSGFVLEMRIGDYASRDRFHFDIVRTDANVNKYLTTVSVDALLNAENAVVTEVLFSDQLMRLKIEGYESLDYGYCNVRLLLIDINGNEYEIAPESLLWGESSYGDENPYLQIDYSSDSSFGIDASSISKIVITSNVNGEMVVVDI